jgi:methyltransferase family protein
MSQNERGHISAQLAHSGIPSRDLARHSFTARMARGRRTICVGRDPGELAAHVTRTARQVIAVYVSAAGVPSAADYHTNSRLSFVCGDWHNFPFPEGSVDLVVSFDRIQSLDEWQLFAAEARRVLTDQGLLITSPPDSDDQRGHSHTGDLDDCPWYSRLIHHFSHTRVIAQAHSDAIIFSLPEVTEAELFVEGGNFGPSRQSLIAICSGVPVLSSPPVIYIPDRGNVLRAREKHIRLLQAELSQKTEWLRKAENEIALARRAYQTLQSQSAEDIEKARHAIDVLEQENLAKTSWSQSLDAEIQRLHGIVRETPERPS